MYWACLWNHCGAQMRDKRSRTALWWGGAVTWHVFVFFKLRHLQPLPSAGSFSLFHLPKYTSRSNTTIARLSPGCVGQIRLSERQTGFWRKGLKTRRRSVACAAPAHKQSVKKKKKRKRGEPLVQPPVIKPPHTPPFPRLSGPEHDCSDFSLRLNGSDGRRGCHGFLSAGEAASCRPLSGLGCFVLVGVWLCAGHGRPF